jgi:hypothetical protein
MAESCEEIYRVDAEQAEFLQIQPMLTDFPLI